MKILDIGSLNIDRVYSVDHFVKEGETISADRLEFFNGGKGLNQSIACAKAGAEVIHAGAVGRDGTFLIQLLKDSGVHADDVQVLDEPSGHAVIQLTSGGQNCIIISHGANFCLKEEYIDRMLEKCDPGDLLLLQNEVNNLAYAMTQAKKRGMKIAFNASPITDAIASCPLQLVDYFLVNETEGSYLSSLQEGSSPEILAALHAKFPQAVIVLTVGSDGVLYQEGDTVLSHPAYRVHAVDTTGAGDTFTGFFLAGVCKGLDAQECLRVASLAAARAVTIKGAANSIPDWNEMEDFAKQFAEK